MEIVNNVGDARLKKYEISRKFGMARSTLPTIKKNWQKIECVVLLISSPSCKQMRNAKTEEVKNSIYERERNQSNFASFFFADALNVSDFQCLSVWLQWFKKDVE